MAARSPPARNPRTNNFCGPELQHARLVRQHCCRSPSDPRHSTGSTPATASTHSGSPPRCPTCEKGFLARLPTNRAKTEVRDEFVPDELVGVHPVVVPESHPRSHTDRRSVPKLPGPTGKRGLVRDGRSYADWAPNMPPPESDHRDTAD